MIKTLKYISVAGYGSTGSSAVVNLLEEVEQCFVLKGEFRFIQDPDGLADLYSNLKNFWGWNRSDAYIRRFLHYTNILGRNPHYFQFGENFNKKLNNKFFQYRDEFLNEIIDTKWNGYWFYHDYQENNPIIIFLERLKRYSKRFGVSKETIRKMTKKSDTYFVRHDINLEKAIQNFIDKIFLEITSGTNKELLVLDQLILPYNTHIFNNLFGNLKQIVVNRDPRDVFLDAMTYNAYPITKNINTFISFYESQLSREVIYNSDSLLKIQFEDLIYNYDITINEIFNFLEIDKKLHILKKTRLNPDISIKNTQTWKRKEFSIFKNNIEVIEKELEQWCYNF